MEKAIEKGNQFKCLFLLQRTSRTDSCMLESSRNPLVLSSTGISGAPRQCMVALLGLENLGPSQ